MKSEINIGGRMVGEGHPVFVIAEVSCNHMGDYKNAENIVRAAAESGADAVKLQTYTAETMTIDSDKEWFRVKGDDNPDSWKDRTLFQLYKEAHTPWEWQLKLKLLAEELGIILFSTPFDPSAVKFLEEELNPPCYKVASYELTDDTLLEAIAKTKKPVILSNGYASFEELSHAMDILREYQSGDIVLLYCVTEYENTPTSTNVNLSTMKDIQEKFNVVVGLSDNNGGITLPELSVLYGAAVIEKHLMLHKGDATLDERFSVVPEELTEMVRRIREIENSDETYKIRRLQELDPDRQWLGKPVYGPISNLEIQNTHLRRSLFVVEDIKAGGIITPRNVRSIRPQVGLAPRHYHEVMGKTVTKDVERGTPLSLDLL